MSILKVASIRAATPTSRIVRLALDGRSFSYRAGQAAMLGLPDAADLTPYSIASSPDETAREGWLEFLVKVDAASRFGAVVSTIGRGSEVVVRGPLGAFVFPERPEERRFLFVAGGTGIAPLRSMIRHALYARVPGAMRLVYVARSPEEFGYLRELRALARRGALELTLASTRDVPERWRYLRGRPGGAILARLVDDPATLCFICGPPSMLTELPPLLIAMGVPKARIRTEEW